MSIKRLFDAVERRGDIGRRLTALVLPISNRPRMTSSCAGEIGLRETGEHTSGPNLASRDDVAHSQTLYTVLETPPPVVPLCRKQARTYSVVGLPRSVGAVLPPSNEYFPNAQAEARAARLFCRRHTRCVSLLLPASWKSYCEGMLPGRAGRRPASFPQH
jgi:hypothetical protein